MIELSHVSKVIKSNLILQKMSFSIGKGECVALIGPNGAGKTTLMRCLLGDSLISSGRISINGLSPRDDKLKQTVAFLPQENALPKDLKVIELLHFFQEIYKSPLSEVEIDALLGFTDEQKQQFAGKLSGGQRRLLSFILTLIGKPSVLFLDEPTAAMDTSTRKRFWEIVGHLREQGVTIVYSSHYIEEVEHTAGRILVLHKGQLIKDTTPYQMRSEEREKQFTLPKEYMSILDDLDDVRDIADTLDSFSFKTKDPRRVWHLLERLECPIADIEMVNKTLLDSLFDNTEEVLK
ncbi:ABC transporter ATP-binding protein [Streptococcus sp. zg-JUN1979]|uniref:ABC transporter ATP-binding protein n=1 Tax=Streptococcus sp. zg-JUN1979 TaxID=3391450 RepID=UPI0039A4B3AC